MSIKPSDDKNDKIEVQGQNPDVDLKNQSANANDASQKENTMEEKVQNSNKDPEAKPSSTQDASQGKSKSLWQLFFNLLKSTFESKETKEPNKNPNTIGAQTATAADAAEAPKPTARAAPKPTTAVAPKPTAAVAPGQSTTGGIRIGHTIAGQSLPAGHNQTSAGIKTPDKASPTPSASTSGAPTTQARASSATAPKAPPAPRSVAPNATSKPLNVPKGGLRGDWSIKVDEKGNTTYGKDAQNAYNEQRAAESKASGPTPKPR